jgi:4-hydroxy-4-methyl-2-oxoglutarate aldolase
MDGTVGWVAGPAAVGPAYTVQAVAGDNFALHVAVSRAQPGDVIVASAGEVRFGSWGEILTVAARRAGIAGLVLDGFVRDLQEIERLEFPVFARGTALTKTAKLHEGTHGVPVTVGDVEILPGDLVVADRDGIVVVPADDYESVLVRAERIREIEASIAEAVAAGASTLDLIARLDG